MADNIKVVMVDDEEDLCFMVQENLKEKAGIEVVTTCNSEEAEDLVAKEQPDIVLMDVVMPGKKGPEIVGALKKNAETKKIPIIVVSGKGEMVFDKKKDEFKWTPNAPAVKERGELPNAKGAEALAEAYGVEDYISKPFTTDLLIQVINDVLARVKKRKAADEEQEEF